MYIIYNSDGSIEKKSITEYIQQGNSYANVLFVTVKDTDLGDYTASAIVTLPNGQNVGAIVEESSEPVEIDGVEYDGYYITLDETCTLMAGAIRISLSLTIEETRMVTYPIYLNVNATPYDADAPVMISYNQYLQLLASVAEVTTPNNPTITLQKNGSTVASFSLNQASNQTINYVLSKSDVGLGNVDNTSDATKKSNFTGSIANGNTGFVTGGEIYNYVLLKNVSQDINSNKRFINEKQLQFDAGSSNPVGTYTIGNESGELCLSKYHYDVGTGTNVRDYLIQWDGENLYPSATSTYNLGKTNLKWKKIYTISMNIAGATLSGDAGGVSNFLKINDYILASDKFYHQNSSIDLGSDSNRWNVAYINELNFSKTIGALGTKTYSFKISGGGSFQLNNTHFQIDENGRLEVPSLSIRGLTGSDSWGLAVNSSDSNDFYIKHFHFIKGHGNEAFYHEIGSYYDTVWGPADLGTSTYPWKDLYLSGKINELTVPNSTNFPQNKGTIALKEDMSPIIIEAGVTPSTIKAWSQRTPADTHKIYLADATTWTDITSEYQNGDYDSLTLGNSSFNSSNKTIDLNAIASSYIAFRIAGVNGYFISQSYKLINQIMSWSGRTIVVIDDGLPNRVCIDSVCYKS